jgi:opacity protein-like surface antigen
MKLTTVLLAILISASVGAQELNLKGNQGGLFSLGVRTTISTFNGHADEGLGMGLGGQFRLQFADRVNSDWFFDYMKSNIGDYAERTDYHIGWSVLYYFTDKPFPKWKPYILAGHCFDYTRMVANANRSNMDERWSSAVQAGVGVHFNLSDRLDLSLVGQYMIHLGNEVHADLHSDGEVHFHEHKGASLEGHLLFNVGVNYKIGDLW